MRIRHVLAVFLTVAASLLLVAGPAAGISGRRPASTPGPSAVKCAGPTQWKSDGTPWTCTFDDEFTGTSLDTSKWSTWNGVNYFNEPGVCYYSDPDNVAVRNGYLKLSVTKLSTPQSCTTPAGTTSASYGAGVAYTQGNFSQTYGMFSARIKFAGGVGLHSAFWMYPDANDYPGHAEIDVAEPWGALPNTVFASTHITGLNSVYVSGTDGCTVNRWSSGFHIYSVQWTSTAITFSYDGQTCYSYTNWTPLAGYSAPAPFDQPFYLILQDLVDNGTYSPAPDGTTAFPANTQVDWVRAWK